ncbi:MAG: bifunctional oligoribonuclease/PAP phosphatase NrnA [Clostridiaceae bacterium]
MSDFAAIIDYIKKSDTIGITFHTSPDGDSLGSAIALLLGLNELGKDSYILCEDKIPELYNFIPYFNNIDNDNDYKLDKTDIVIVLDCGNKERISGNIIVNTEDYKVLNIDHHISNQKYGFLNYIDTKASAVGEIVFQILNELDIEITKDIATCLYTSIATDTGFFKFSNTTSRTLTIVGSLIDKGVNFPDIYRRINSNKKYERVKLYAKVIDAMKLNKRRNICILKLTEDILNDFKKELGDTSDIINIGMEIDTVEVCILLKEIDGCLKISLRSKTFVDVSKVASQFGGGGHVRASGLTMKTNILDAEAKLVKAIEKELI